MTILNNPKFSEGMKYAINCFIDNAYIDLNSDAQYVKERECVHEIYALIVKMLPKEEANRIHLMLEAAVNAMECTSKDEMYKKGFQDALEFKAILDGYQR